MRAGTTLGVVPALIASIHRPSHEGAVTPSDSTLTTQLPEGYICRTYLCLTWHSFLPEKSPLIGISQR